MSLWHNRILEETTLADLVSLSFTLPIPDHAVRSSQSLPLEPMGEGEDFNMLLNKKERTSESDFAHHSCLASFGCPLDAAWSHLRR